MVCRIIVKGLWENFANLFLCMHIYDPVGPKSHLSAADPAPQSSRLSQEGASWASLYELTGLASQRFLCSPEPAAAVRSPCRRRDLSPRLRPRLPRGSP